MTLKLNMMILGLCAAAGLMAADVHSDAGTAKNTAEKLLTEVKAARVASTDLAMQLKSKSADMSKVTEDVATVEKSAIAIQSLMETLESKSGELYSKQQANLSSAKQLSELLNVFVANKKNLVADGATPEERERIRAYALMVSQRADSLEKSIRRMAL